MDEDYARKKAKCLEAINGIILLMRKNGISIPSKYQKSRVHEDLPTSPNSREAEVLRRFRYLEPESRDQLAERLNDLLVYAEVAKALRSELIAIVVLSKLRKWEDFLLHPELEIPPIPPPSPEQKRRLVERKKMIEERDQRTANTLRQYEEYGEDRRAAVQTMNPFASQAKTIILPPQTIGPPQSQAEGGAAQRVNLEEQRRREIAEYEKFGEIKKQLHDQPGYDRNLKGTKLPDHELPHPSRQGERDETQQLLYKELAKQRRLDELRRHLREALASMNINNANRLPDNKAQPTTAASSSEQAQRLLQQRQDREQRVATVLRQHEQQGAIRRAAVESVNPFTESVRTTRLPPQTIGPPQSQRRGEATSARVDIEEQRRKELAKYQRLGTIKKRLHDMPEFDRDAKGPKLPEHQLPSSSHTAGPSAPQSQRTAELENQRQVEALRQQLRSVLTTHKRQRSNDPDNDQKSPPGKRNKSQQESTEEGNRRIAAVLRQYRALGERRRDAVQSSQSRFRDRIKTPKLPPQTIPLRVRSDAITTPRVDIDEQRRREIEDHQKFGSIRKQQHELPEYQRDVIGPRLPVHGLPLPSTSQGSSFKNLEKQREVDKLKRELLAAFVSSKKTRSNDPESCSSANPQTDANIDPNNPEAEPNSPDNESNNDNDTEQ